MAFILMRPLDGRVVFPGGKGKRGCFEEPSDERYATPSTKEPSRSVSAENLFDQFCAKYLNVVLNPGLLRGYAAVSVGVGTSGELASSGSATAG